MEFEHTHTQKLTKTLKVSFEAIFIVHFANLVNKEKDKCNAISLSHREFRNMIILIQRLIIGHLRVPKNLTFKTRLSAKPLL